MTQSGCVQDAHPRAHGAEPVFSPIIELGVSSARPDRAALTRIMGSRRKTHENFMGYGRRENELVSWIARIVLIVAGIVASWLVAKDAPYFRTLQLATAVLLVVLILVAIAFWPARWTAKFRRLFKR